MSFWSSSTLALPRRTRAATGGLTNKVAAGGWQEGFLAVGFPVFSWFSWVHWVGLDWFTNHGYPLVN